MSRSTSRRPTTHSRGSSSQGHRSLSVTEALQNIRFTETVSDHHVGLPSSYISRRRASHRDETIHPERSSDTSTLYAPGTLDPAVLDSSRSHDQSPYSNQPFPTSSPYSSTSGSMRYVASRNPRLSLTDTANSYPAYSQAPLSNPYRQMTSRSPNYGKLAALAFLTPLVAVGSTKQATPTQEQKLLCLAVCLGPLSLVYRQDLMMR